MSKKFVSDKMTSQDGLSEPAYQMVWHSLGSKEYSSTFLDHLKETEVRVLKQANDKAKEKALHIEKEAYEKGFAQGEKDGLELGQKLGQQRIETIVQQMATLLQEIQNRWESLYKTYEREMFQLAVSISKKILHHDLQVNEEIITATLREVSKHIVDQRKVMIRLNPADFQFLQTHAGSVLPPEKGGQGVEMINDPLITRGGCVVETAFGGIDGTIETQFEQIVSLLWERFGESGQLPSRDIA